MPADLQQARELFLHAVGKLSPEQWEGYVAEACGEDAELAQQVGHLLQVHREAGSFLDRPAAAVGATGGFTPVAGGEVAAVPLRECPGTVIGPYKLLQQIGEGGMGTVYMAEQTQPVQRIVALKVIKPGMDSCQVIARFAAERQALAMMDHVNIARVLDAGATEAGLPYFVMELVHGVPITRYCDDNHLTPRERLELFVPVCQAIQHAHTKGIIHRDVKPSNVLVTLYDGRAVPKVIDFGIAKATEQKLTERTLFTQYGTAVGTLEYMSPEQAEMSALGVDTRSDIYSLGVLLYELLTGSTPLGHKRVREAAYGEVLRMIKEEEPPWPSIRLSDPGEALASISAQRRMGPAKLARLVRGELDWIVMKALEKDRNRRYETAKDFAADVRRYLSDEPVQACPPSAWYRFRKFARRNKRTLATATLLGALVFAVGVLGWVAHDQAARQVVVEQTVARALEVADDWQRQERWPEALAAAERAEAALAGSGGDGELDRRVRERLADLRMVQRLEEIRLQPEQVNDLEYDIASADRAYATAFHEYGIDVDSLTVQEAGERIRSRSELVVPALAAAVDDWAYVRGQKDRAGGRMLAALAQAAESDPWRRRVRQALQAHDWTTLQEIARSSDLERQSATTKYLLGVTLYNHGKREQGLEVLRKAQRRFPGDFWINVSLGDGLRPMGASHLDERICCYTAALAIRPNSAALYNNLGSALQNKGLLDQAIGCYEQAIRVKKDYYLTHNNLGVAFRKKNLLDQAIASYQEAIRLKQDFAQAHEGLGLAFGDQGKWDEAIACFRKAIHLRNDRAEAYGNLGNALNAKGRPDEAIVACQKAIALKKDYPEAHDVLGSALRNKGRPDEAIAFHQKAIRLKEDSPEAHNNLGVAYGDKAQWDEAIAAWQKAIALKKDFAEAHGNLGAGFAARKRPNEAIAAFQKAIRLKPNLALAHNNLGSALSDKGLREEAIASWQKAILLKKDFDVAHFNLGRAFRNKGHWEQAIASYKETIRWKPTFPEAHNELAWLLATCPDLKSRDAKEATQVAQKAVKLAPMTGGFWNTLGVAQYRAGDHRAALEALKKSMELRKGGDSNDWFFLAMAHWQLGNKVEARRWCDRAVVWMEKNSPKDEDLRRFRDEARELLGIQENTKPKND